MSNIEIISRRIQSYYTPAGDSSETAQVMTMRNVAEYFAAQVADLDSADFDEAEVNEDVLDALAEDENFQRIATPLGEQLGYCKVGIDDKAVMETAKAAYRRSPEYTEAKIALGYGADEKGPRLLTAPWQYMVEPLKAAYQAGAIEAGLGKDFAKTLADEQCFGKGHIGWIYVPGKSTPLDLCGKNWRWSDWTRPKCVRMTPEHGLPLLNLNMLMVKEGLGDGIDAVVTPGKVGLPADTVNVYQNRAFIMAPDGTIVRLYKGLLVVHPDADNTLAYQDGYGWDVLNADVHGITPENPGNLHIYNMLDVAKFSPRSRYTIQGLQCQGVPGWERVALAVENIHLAASSSDRMVEDLMLRADVPLKALGGMGLVTALSRLLRITVQSGVCRVILPDQVFKHIKGQEYIHESLQKKYRSRVTGRKIYGFYAPASQRAYFEANGGVGSEWVGNRRPDLPPGVCTARMVLLGYVDFNCFVVNHKALKLSGADFDGDMACFFPPAERGGLYIAFNDLPTKEILRRLRLAGVGDRKGQEKKDYPDGLARHAGCIACRPLLGAADVTSRKMRDVGLRDECYSLTVWIQASVDMQKRDMALPDPRGAIFMPKVKIDPKLEITATQLLRALTKGEPQGWDELTPSEKASYPRQWERFSFKLEQLYFMSKLAGERSPLELLAPTPEFAQMLSRFGFELGTRMAKAVAEQDVWRSSNEGIPVRYKFDFPQPQRQMGNLSEVEHPGIRTMGHTVALLDANWGDLKEKAKSSSKFKVSLYAFKDGLREVALQHGLLGTLSRFAASYEVFQMFADADAYREYFAGDTTSKRISSLFCVLDQKSFVRGENGVYANPKPVYVGLHQYAAGDITIQRKDGGLLVTAKHPEFDVQGVKEIRFKGSKSIKRTKGTVQYVSKAGNIQDALLGLRYHVAGLLLKHGKMLHPSQLAVEEVFEKAAKREAEKQAAKKPTGPATECSWDDLVASHEAALAAALSIGSPTAPVEQNDTPEAALLAELQAWGGAVPMKTIKKVESFMALGAEESDLLASFSI